MVTLVAGPLNGQHCAMNHEALQNGRKPRRRSPNDSAASSPRANPSKDALARIARSTAQLSTQIKYISYVVAYSAAGTPRDGESRGVRDSARRRSGKTSIAGRREEGASSAANMGAFKAAQSHLTTPKKVKEEKEAKKQRAASPRPPKHVISEEEIPLEPSYERHLQTVASRPENQGPGIQPTPKEGRPEDKYKNKPEYPLSDGFLRDEYVETFAVRFKVQEIPWKVSYLRWFWSDLCTQRRMEKLKPDNFMYLIAAVELHEHMMALPYIRKKGTTPPKEQQWRDVVDSLSNDIHYGAPGVKHNVGNEKMTFPGFLAFWQSDLVANDRLHKPIKLWD